MASKSETGHAKNVANLDDLIHAVKGLGVKYNPSGDEITLVGLQALKTNAKQALQDMSTGESTLNDATNERAAAFATLPQLATQVLASFSIVSTAANVKDLKALHRKIHGLRAGKKDDPPPPETEGDQQVSSGGGSHSVSQRSFDNLLTHLGKMADVVKLNPKYMPNEVELSVEGLTARLTELENLNMKVDQTETALKNARINRGVVLYGADTGLVAVAQKVKKYVKSVWKANSPQYKLVNGIPFRTIRN